MNTTAEPPTEELQLAPVQPDEAPMKQLAPYDEFKTQIEKLKVTAETITVTDISQTAEMKIARTTRLALKDIRVAITHRHRELKENILIEGRKIDAGKNELLDILEPLELRLKDQEEFIERETTRIQAENRVARIAEITPFLAAPLAVDLGVVTDSHYAGMLQDAKDAHAARIERAAKEKVEAEAAAKKQELSRARALELAPLVRFVRAKITDLGEMSADDYAALLKEGRDGERAEAEAIEAQRIENERLKKEAEAREAAAKKEREAAAAAAAKAKAESEERERVAAEAARKEREAIEAKAAAEKKAAQEKAAEAIRIAGEKAKKEREAREKIEAELAVKKAAEAKAAAEKAAAEKAAAMAPKKEKLKAFAKTVRQLAVPLLAEVSEVKDFSDGVERFAKWIEKKAEELDGEKLL